MAEGANVATRTQSDASEDRSAEEIRRDIAATRESIKDTVGLLNDRVEMALDWRTHVAESPLVAIGAAAGIGFLLSRLFRPRPSVSERLMDALVDGFEDITGRVRDRFDDLAPQRSSPGRAVKAAATALATQAVIAYVKGKYLEGPDDPAKSRTQEELPRRSID